MFNMVINPDSSKPVKNKETTVMRLKIYQATLSKILKEETSLSGTFTKLYIHNR